VATAVDEQADEGVDVEYNGQRFKLRHGAVVLAAITSCTNTSNPSVMLAAGLLARNAARLGLTSKPWVKTSLSPGSRVVTEYYEKAGVMRDLEQLGFFLTGLRLRHLHRQLGARSRSRSRTRSSRASSSSRGALGEPATSRGASTRTRGSTTSRRQPLVVAYALAGGWTIDFDSEPIGVGSEGPVFCATCGPPAQEVEDRGAAVGEGRDVRAAVRARLRGRREVALAPGAGRARRSRGTPRARTCQNPPYFAGHDAGRAGRAAVEGARVLGMFGDSITTDHISPAGNIAAASPAGKWLIAHGVKTRDFNSYGARRGHHEVMMRGTFANIRLRNELVRARGRLHHDAPGGDPRRSTTWRCAYQEQGTPLVILAGKEYGTGSSRDWAAKGTVLLGVRAVIAESFERIHRSNLGGDGRAAAASSPTARRASRWASPASSGSPSRGWTRRCARARRSRCARSATTGAPPPSGCSPGSTPPRS
jgi:aconitate hydratase